MTQKSILRNEFFFTVRTFKSHPTLPSFMKLKLSGIDEWSTTCTKASLWIFDATRFSFYRSYTVVVNGWFSSSSYWGHISWNLQIKMNVRFVISLSLCRACHQYRKKKLYWKDESVNEKLIFVLKTKFYFKKFIMNRTFYPRFV